jgi:hypothetical protein
MAKKIKISKMPNTVFIDNAKILGQLIKAKRTERGLGIKLTSKELAKAETTSTLNGEWV